jgi:outer membrane protein assembly factor BamB
MTTRFGCTPFIAATLAVAASTSITAQHWPAFRGPAGSGVADAQPVPLSWNGITGTGVVWKTALPGLGHSSPVVWGNRVFVTTAISSNADTQHNPKDAGIDPSKDASVHEWRVLALDKARGTIVWSRTAQRGTPKSKRHVKATQANATPVTDGRYLAVAFGSEGLFVYDVHGKELWKKDLGVLDPGYYGQPDLQWGYASSPVIHGELLILQCDLQKNSFIVAFNLADGTQVWRTERDDIPAWSTPVIYHGKTRTELVTSGSRFYRAYDPRTGKELWRLHDGGEVKVPSPVVANDLFFLSGGNPRGREFYVVRPGGSGDISPGKEEATRYVAWRKAKGSPYTPTPLVYGGHLYICNDNGVLTVYDAATGDLVYQARVGTTNSTFSASPVAARGRIYLASEDGEVFVVRAGEKYELLATNRMGEALMATPAISDGMLLIRGQRHLFAVR